MTSIGDGKDDDDDDFNWKHNFKYFASLNEIIYYIGYGFINNEGEKQNSTHNKV